MDSPHTEGPQPRTDAASMSGRQEKMARWRWLLFAAMARYEAGEDVYLRIPAARLSRCDVSMTIPRLDAHARDRARGGSSHGRSWMGRWACNGPVSLPRRMLGWLRRK